MGSLRRKTWGDKAGRKGPVHLLAVTRGVTPPPMSLSAECKKCLYLLARPDGFEPPTPRFVVWCSIQLSYGRVLRIAREVFPNPAKPAGTGL
jgi:hypothetical protein